MKFRYMPGAAALLVAAMTLAACGGNDKDESSSATAEDLAFDLSAKSVGPYGEPSTHDSELPELTDEDIAKIQAGNYKVAILHGGSGTWYNSNEKGIQAEAAALGMEIVAQAQADFDPAKQATQIETAMASDPDIVVSLPVEPSTAAQAFKPVVDAGAELVLIDNGIDGWTAGEEYVSIVAGDHYQQGIEVAKLMVDALGDEGGEIGYIYYDADFFVTNNRDQSFRAYLAQEHPEIEIVAEEGFTTEAQTSEVAAAMLTKNPDLDGIYVSWSAAATGVLAALREAGNTTAKVVTYDLDATNDLQMANGENLYGTVADKPYLMGQQSIRLAALSILGKGETYPFVVSDPVPTTRDNLEQAWIDSTNEPPPAEVVAALD